MADKYELSLDIGDGLKLDNGKLSVKANMDLHTIKFNSDGVFVESLKGKDGVGGHSIPDGWTTKTSKGWSINDNSIIDDFIDMDRDVVNLIFTFGPYMVQMRHPETITYNTAKVKDVRAICNEINAPKYYKAANKTCYHPQLGEMIQLVTNPRFRHAAYDGNVEGTIAVENMNRLNDDHDAQVVQAMFVITDINYQSDIDPGGDVYWVHDMTLICIYSDLPDFVVGSTYSGDSGFDPDHGYI